METIKSLGKRDKGKVLNILSRSRKKVSNKWKGYQKQKATIKRNFKRDSTIKEKTKNLLIKTYENISTDWGVYREEKHTIIYKKKFDSLTLTKTSDYINPKKEFNSRQEWYNTNIGIEKINPVIENIFKKRDVKYILLTIKYKHEKSGIIKYASDVYTKESFDNIKDDDLEEEFLKKIMFDGDTDLIKKASIINYYIRVVYRYE